MPLCSVMQSPMPLKLLDMPGHVAISSMSPPDPANGNATLATYRYTYSHPSLHAMSLVPSKLQLAAKLHWVDVKPDLCMLTKRTLRLATATCT